MKKTNTRTFLLTVSPLGDHEPAPTAESVDREIWPRLSGNLITLTDYQVPARGRLAFDFALGQRVCNRRDGKIARVEGFEFDSENQLIAHVMLEAPYVSQPWTGLDGTEHPGGHETWRYYWPVWQMQAIGEAPAVEEEQRKLAEACAPWFEVQS